MPTDGKRLRCSKSCSKRKSGECKKAGPTWRVAPQLNVDTGKSSKFTEKSAKFANFAFQKVQIYTSPLLSAVLPLGNPYLNMVDYHTPELILQNP